MRVDVLIGAAQLVAPSVLLGTLAGRSLGWPIRAFAGAVATGVLVIVAHGLRVPQPLALAATFAAAAAAVPLARRLRRDEAPADARDRLLRVLLALLLLVPAASTTLRALAEPVVAWDGLELWFAKARAVYLWTPLREAPYPSYPELGPTLWILPARWTGLELEGVGRAFLSGTFFLWVAALPAALGSPVTPARVAAALAAGLVAFDPVALTNGYQDGLVLVAAGFAALVLARILVRVRAVDGPLDEALASFAAAPEGRRELRVAGFLAGAVPLVKLEGTVWSLLLGGAFVATLSAGPWIRSPGRIARALRPFLVPWLATALLWPALAAWNGIPFQVQDGAFSASSVARALANLDRWPLIRPHFEAYFASRGPILAACAAASVGCVLVAPRLARALVFLWVVFAADLAFLALVYLSTQLDLRWHISTSFDRLVFQAGFSYVLAGAIAAPASAEALCAVARDFVRARR